MLVKPQFEAGREQVGKRGVVGRSGYVQVLEDVLAKAEELEFSLWNLDFSPIQGPGQCEYLTLAGRRTEKQPPLPEVVAAAHRHFA